MSFEVAPIVEGHGDVLAVPGLLRRIEPTLIIRRPVRFPRTRLLQSQHLHRAARIAASNIRERGGILLLIDADSDCAAQLAPRLEAELRQYVGNRPCRVALAVREFEAWIVGGVGSYGVDRPDHTGGLKDRLRAFHGAYHETADQARLMAAADLTLLESRSRSFRRLLKVIREFAGPTV